MTDRGTFTEVPAACRDSAVGTATSWMTKGCEFQATEIFFNPSSYGPWVDSVSNRK
jgi:hypothetical protein